MRRLFLTLGLALLAGVARPSQAGYIPGVTATTTMGSGLASDLQNTVNGMGLNASPTLLTSHNGTDALNSWLSSTGVLSGEVTFDLHGSYFVNQFLFWNLNAGGAANLGAAGIRNVVVLSSTNGIVFNPIAGAPLEFSRVLSATSLPESFTFAPVQATHLRFAILNNWGDMSRTGFGDVAFNGVSVLVPEPSSTVLCGIFGVFTIGWARFRRRPVVKS